jgi:hypothetical protein
VQRPGRDQKRVTVRRLEARSHYARRATLQVIKHALEAAGVEFIDDGGPNFPLIRFVSEIVEPKAIRPEDALVHLFRRRFELGFRAACLLVPALPALQRGYAICSELERVIGQKS